LKRTASGILVTLLLIGMLTFAFNIQSVKASGTIYIRADGSIDPPTAPIQRSGEVYSFTSNIYGSIVVERDSIVIDGNGFMLQGTGADGSRGIDLSGRENVTIQNAQVKAFSVGIGLIFSSGNNICGNSITTSDSYGIDLWEYSSGNSIYGNNITNNIDGIGLECFCNNNSIIGNNITNNDVGIFLYGNSNYNRIFGNNIKANNYEGIWLDQSSGNSICGNNVKANNYFGIGLYYSSGNSISGNNIATNNNYDGIEIYYSSNNTVCGNNIANNEVGIFLIFYSSNNVIYHNNFVNNTLQVDTHVLSSANIWDDGYPSGGNYWSDYTDVDLNDDGIWDHPYVIDANNQDHYPLINLWTPTPPNQPPTCIISLQRNGIEISEIEIGEFLDIFAGHSRDDKGIKQIRFSSDDVQDGMPTGRWTDWFDWDISSGDWDASAKTKCWSFATSGHKEVWAEAKDQEGQTSLCSNIVFVPARALPTLVSPLVITPTKEIYNLRDTLDAEFTIKNIGNVSITLDVLTVGGRLNGFIPPEGAPDFTFDSVTLHPNETHEYHGSLTLTQFGNYHFFVAYRINNPTPEEKKLLDENNWNTCVDLGEGLTQTDRVKNIIVFEEGTVPEEVNALREKIDLLKKKHVSYPPYLLEVNSWNDAVSTLWADFTSFITRTDLREKYDELYQTGFNYQWFRIRSLIDAGNFLDGGDITNAKKYLQKSYTYEKLSWMSFSAAAEVFDGNIAAGQVLADGIKQACEAAVRHGIAIVCPAAAVWIDAFYMGFDFAFNTALEGWKQAEKDLAIDATFTVIFKQVQFVNLDYDTLENYVNTVGTNVPLDTLLRDNEFMAEFGVELRKVITDRIGEEVTEETIEQIISYVIRYYESMKDSIQIKANCPVELRAVDSQEQITGLVNGKVIHEISMSLYYNETVTILFPNDTYQFENLGTSEGVYNLEIVQCQNGSCATFDAVRIPISINATHLYTVDWAALSQGEDGVAVQVDSDGDSIFEYNFTSDSELSRVEYVAATTEHDLGITGIASSKSVVGEGYTLPINVTIMNYGAYTEAFNVAICVNTTLAVTQTVTLANGSSTTVTFTWDTRGFAKGNYTIKAAVDTLPDETYTADNTFTGGWVVVAMVGDIASVDKHTGRVVDVPDGKVDIVDVAKVARRFGVIYPDPSYDPDCDVTGSVIGLPDGKIDIRDVATVAKNFGKIDP
jgi:parallel beta-helix repeat protein